MTAVNLWLTLSVVLPAADLDNNVEWSGITHVTFQDRRPLCPLDGESFAVQVRTWSDDLTSVTVWVDDGAASLTSVGAAMIGTRGPYDVWQAQIPATTSEVLTYYFQLTDGTDSDYLGADGMTNTPPAGAEFVIDYVTLSHAPLGATPHPAGGTVFNVWAPNPTSAYVRGEFNGWGLSNPMTRDGDFFRVFIPSAEPGRMYKFFFNPGGVWKPAARARDLNPADNYNARIADPFGHAWNDAGFQTPAFE
ncbi:MAG: alpha amylase N-terminal ig-like domain-containing protein, partial [Phycisphaerae bacterium]